MDTALLWCNRSIYALFYGTINNKNGVKSMEKNRIRPIAAGKNMRMSYSRQKEVLEMPNLIEVQKNSYNWFLTDGRKEAFDDISPISDFAGHLSLEFMDFTLCRDEVKYTIEECKERDAAYAAPLKVKVRLINNDKDEISEHFIFMGDLPLMTDTGSFVINGAERVIVSQLVRSPGVYFAKEVDKDGEVTYKCTVIPKNGAWMEFEQDSSGVLYVKVDRKKKVTASLMLRAIGLNEDETLLGIFGDDPILKATIDRDGPEERKDPKKELYRTIKNGEIITDEGVKANIPGIFYDKKRYDISRVGRYKYNKKLSLANRIADKELAEDVADEFGEILATKGTVLSHEKAWEIQNAGINSVYVVGLDGTSVKIIGNNTVDLAAYLKKDPKELGIKELVYRPALQKI